MAKLYIFSLCISMFFFLSCEDTSPQISIVRHMVLYDFSSNKTLPELRLAVYVEVNSDTSRIKTMDITSLESNVTWRIPTPKTINDTSTGKQWVGSSNLASAGYITFLEGNYRLTYTDLAERKVDVFFTISDFDYPENLNNNDYPVKKIAVHDALANTLYYGNVLSESEMLDLYPSATSYREILLRDDYQGAIVYTTNLLQNISD